MSVLYGIPLSTFTRKIRLALGEKGIAYELRPVVMGRQSAELKALHPLGKVPVYEAGGIVIPDSSVIIAWLERVHPSPALYPADAGDYAQALFLEEYADTRLREGIAPVFYERTLKRLYQKQPPDEAVLAKAWPILEECADYFEACLGQSSRGDGPYIVGDRLSVADIAIGAQYATLRQGLAEVVAGRWPKLARWLDSLWRRPVFAALLEEEGALLAQGRMA